VKRILNFLSTQAPCFIFSRSSSLQAIISGDNNGTDPNMYKTAYVAEFSNLSSVNSSNYVQSKPAFDRLSANKTNYEIAPSNKHYDLRTTSHVHHANPSTWESRRGFEKAVIGGWSKPSGEYCVDEASRGVSYNKTHTHTHMFHLLNEMRPLTSFPPLFLLDVFLLID
jgi:hypothetical protein